MRPLMLADVEEIHRLWVEPGMRKYLWDDEIIPREKAHEVVAESVTLFKDHGFGLWAVTFHEQPAITGFCGYWYFHEPPELEILYGISPQHWGRGLATEMARAMQQFGFQYLGFNKILASADAPNAGSFRVMEKAGMKFLKRENRKGLDTITYLISKNDFQFDPSIQFLSDEVDNRK